MNIITGTAEWSLPVFTTSEYTTISSTSEYRPREYRIWGLSAGILHLTLIHLLPALYNSEIEIAVPVWVDITSHRMQSGMMVEAVFGDRCDFSACEVYSAISRLYEMWSICQMTFLRYTGSSEMGLVYHKIFLPGGGDISNRMEFSWVPRIFRMSQSI